jgi:hypothetical protein
VKSDAVSPTRHRRRARLWSTPALGRHVILEAEAPTLSADVGSAISKNVASRSSRQLGTAPEDARVSA